MKIKICERFNSPAIYMTIDLKQVGFSFCSSIFMTRKFFYEVKGNDDGALSVSMTVPP